MYHPKERMNKTSLKNSDGEYWWECDTEPTRSELPSHPFGDPNKEGDWVYVVKDPICGWGRYLKDRIDGPERWPLLMD